MDFHNCKSIRGCPMYRKMFFCILYIIYWPGCLTGILFKSENRLMMYIQYIKIPLDKDKYYQTVKWPVKQPVRKSLRNRSFCSASPFIYRQIITNSQGKNYRLSLTHTEGTAGFYLLYPGDLSVFNSLDMQEEYLFSTASH